MHSSIRIDGGKTQVWNAGGRKPAICEVLDRVAQAADPAAKVWKGSEVLPNQQGLKILGAPFGHPEFVAAQLEKSFQKQETLIRRIPFVPDLQAAWLILLYCASARANYLLRVVDPEQVQQSLRCTIKDCGSACVNFWELQLTCATTLPEVLPLFLSFLEDWV